MCKQLFKYFHATRRNIGKIMFLIKFQECFKKLYSGSRALRNSLLIMIIKNCVYITSTALLQNLLFLAESKFLNKDIFYKSIEVHSSASAYQTAA